MTKLFIHELGLQMTTIHELCILKYSKVTLFFHVTSWHYCCTPINIEPTSPFWVCWTLSKLLPNKLILETLNTMGFKHVNLLQLPFCSCSTFCSTTQQNFMHVGDHFVCASFLHAPFCKTTTLLNVAIEHVQHVAHYRHYYNISTFLLPLCNLLLDMSFLLTLKEVAKGLWTCCVKEVGSFEGVVSCFLH
jgi:hypothetical protein